MKEKAYTIHKQLVGIYTERNAEKGTNPQGKKLPVILFLNSGLLPHVGPYRLYVNLAREFSKLGFSSFRFDLSGIGDSEKHKDSRLYKAQHSEDIIRVIDFLEENENEESFIALGICTGADNAHKTMVKDKRVVGAVSIDGYTYPTWRYYANLYGPKMMRLKSWVTLFKTVLKRIPSLFEAKQEQGPQAIDMSWNKPEKQQTEAEFRDFIARDANLLNIYTASWPYNYQNQLADVFQNIPFGDNLQLAYLEDAEHIFPLVEDRQKLTATITEWLNSRFKAA